MPGWRLGRWLAAASSCSSHWPRRRRWRWPWVRTTEAGVVRGARGAGVARARLMVVAGRRSCLVAACRWCWPCLHRSAFMPEFSFGTVTHGACCTHVPGCSAGPMLMYGPSMTTAIVKRPTDWPKHLRHSVTASDSQQVIAIRPIMKQCCEPLHTLLLAVLTAAGRWCPAVGAVNAPAAVQAAVCHLQQVLAAAAVAAVAIVPEGHHTVSARGGAGAGQLPAPAGRSSRGSGQHAWHCTRHCTQLHSHHDCHWPLLAVHVPASSSAGVSMAST